MKPILKKNAPKYNKKTDYCILTGLWKTVKNSAYLLIPFLIALLVGIPEEYAWIAGPIIYMLKNYIENRK